MGKETTMKSDDRIKKSNIMNRLREKDSSKPVSIEEFCWLLRQNGLSHSQGYFHYTTCGRLQKMLAGEDVGEKEKKRLFFMSASSALNDAEETKPGVYLASFSYGKEEEVAMWTNYGVPKREAVRIRFPLAAMTRWAKENTPDKITIYVRENENALFRALDVKPAEIYFADVAYYGRNDPSEKVKRDTVRYKGENFWFDEERWRDDIRKRNASLLFKKRGWAYEREVRLIVRFDDIALTDRYKRIALPFDSLYDALLTEVKKNILSGPWEMSPAVSQNIEDMINLADIDRSSFYGELNMRSSCDECPAYKKCSCPNAEWRLRK